MTSVNERNNQVGKRTRVKKRWTVPKQTICFASKTMLQLWKDGTTQHNLSLNELGTSEEMPLD